MPMIIQDVLLRKCRRGVCRVAIWIVSKRSKKIPKG